MKRSKGACHRAVANRYRPFRCIDCGTNTLETREYYMVQDEIWQQARMLPKGGMLCIGCLEKRLGRRLDKNDFTDALVNRFPNISKRVLDRLGDKFGGQESVWVDFKRTLKSSQLPEPSQN